MSLIDTYREMAGYEAHAEMMFAAFGVDQDEFEALFNDDMVVDHIGKIFQRCCMEYGAANQYRLLATDPDARIACHAAACNSATIGIMIGIMVGRESMIESS